MLPSHNRHALAASAGALLLSLSAGPVAGAQEPAAQTAAAPAQPAAQTTAAQTADANPSRYRRQYVYFAFYTGTTGTANSDVLLRQPGLNTDLRISDVNWEGRPFSGSIYYGYKIGTFLPNTPRVGFEIEFNHAKAYAKVKDSKRQSGTFQGQPIDEVAPIENRVQEFRITNGINTINLNVLYRFPTFVSADHPDGRLQPYVLVGPHYYLHYAINQVGGVANEPRGYRNSGGWSLGWHAGAGARYFVTPRVGIVSEVKYYDGRARVNIDQGEAETDLRTWHLTGGLMYNF